MRTTRCDEAPPRNVNPPVRPMTRLPRALPIATLLILAACTTSTTSSSSADATTTPEPTLTASPEPTPSPSAGATESPDADPSSSQIEGAGGFTWETSAEADALMEDTFDCQNLDDGYQVDFPAEWNTNAELGGTPPCSWFAPTEYETGAPGDVPDEVAIEIFLVDGDRGYHGDITDRREGFVGATQPATRVLVVVGDVQHYEYVVQLGETPEEGPNLVARTTSEMGGDFDLNRAVLDRMMGTMEFIGVIQ
jgi:hypothetical protein